jgi:hypothetical protein
MGVLVEVRLALTIHSILPNIPKCFHFCKMHAFCYIFKMVGTIRSWKDSFLHPLFCHTFSAH